MKTNTTKGTIKVGDILTVDKDFGNPIGGKSLIVSEIQTGNAYCASGTLIKLAGYLYWLDSGWFIGHENNSKVVGLFTRNSNERNQQNRNRKHYV